MTIDTAALRALAEAATPGPWRPEWSEGDDSYDITGQPHGDMMCPMVGYADAERDAAHIAAFHPGTALALLDEVEALRAQVDRLHTWDGLMHLLDEHWPEGMIPTLPDAVSRDPGPRIVSLLRWVEALRAQVQRVREIHRAVPTYAMADECDQSDDEGHVEGFHFEVAMGDWVCGTSPLGPICSECSEGRDESEDYPCATIRALDGEVEA